MSAPTGQICTVLPEKYDSNGSPFATPTCSEAPRSKNSISGSPAISSAKRMQRAHWMQRSRSSSTSVESGMGFSKVRLVSWKRDSPWPFDMAWFCRGHSPPLSQTGQSSGWFRSSISMAPRWAFSATGEVSWVWMTMPSATSMAQDGCGFGKPRPLPASVMSTRHCRQLAAGSSSGWSQNLGIWMPSSSAARMIKVPFGTLTWKPSTVRVTMSTGCSTGPAGVVCTVMPYPTQLMRRDRTDIRRSRSA